MGGPGVQAVLARQADLERRVRGVVLPVLMYSLTGSAACTGALAALTAAPYLVFGLVAGALVDRVHRRAVMVVTDLVSAGLLASVPVASALDVLTPLHLLLVAAGVASVGVSLTADIREGLEFLWREPAVRLFLWLGLGQAVAGGAVSGLLVVYAFRVFDVPQNDARIGVLFSALAAGSFAAIVLMPAISGTCEPRRTTAAGLTAGVGVLGLLVWARQWWPAVLGIALWGLTSTIVIVNGITVRQLITPDRLQGRVNLVGRMVTFGPGQPAGALAGGVLADALPVRSALVTAALPLAVAAVVGWSRRGVERGGELGHGLK